jgi:hypothetical protein
MDRPTIIIAMIATLLIAATVFEKQIGRFLDGTTPGIELAATGVVVGPDGRIGTTTTLTPEQIQTQATTGCAGCHSK